MDLKQRNAPPVKVGEADFRSQVLKSRQPVLVAFLAPWSRPCQVLATVLEEVATAYGMIHPGQSNTQTVRCVFFIDPNQIIRAILYYPLTTGRNMQEILRIADCLQTTDEYKVATPANWQPGKKVVVPAPGTQEAAAKRMGEGYECVDWYLCKKNV